MKGHHIFAYTVATAAAAAAVLFCVFTATAVSASIIRTSIRGASDSGVDSTHYHYLTKEAEVEVGVAITSDSLKDHPAADTTFFKIAKSESKLALYDEEAIEDEDPEDFEVEVESSNSNPSQEGEYDEYGDEDEFGLESFHEDVSVPFKCPEEGEGGNDYYRIFLEINFPEGTALEMKSHASTLTHPECFITSVEKEHFWLIAKNGIDNFDEYVESVFHAVLPGQSDGCECGLRISYNWPKYILAVSGCDCFHITHYDWADHKPAEGNVWPCTNDGCRSLANLRVHFSVEAN